MESNPGVATNLHLSLFLNSFASSFSLTHTEHSLFLYTHSTTTAFTHTPHARHLTHNQEWARVCVWWELGGVLWRSSLQGSGRPGGVGCQPCFVFLMVERCCLMVERCFQYLPGGGEGRWDVGSLTKFSAFGFLRAPRMLTNPGHTH